jgi:hypothetical protein
MTEPAPRAARGISFEQMLVGLAFALVAGAALMMPAGPDTYWSLRAGQDFWRTGHVPLTETYSYTAAGRLWPNHEWLWQALAYALVRAGGMPLLLLVSAAIVVTAFALAHRLARGRPQRPQRPIVRFALAALTILLASFMWVVRPQLVTFLLLLVLLTAVAAERYFFLLPLLFVVWANIHGAVALGGVALVGMTVAGGLRALVPWATPADRRRALRLLIVLPLCGLATALTPLGLGMWRSIGGSVAASHHTGIMEWQPLRLDDPYGLIVLALAIAFVGLVVARRRWLARAGWDDWAITAAALALLPLAIYAVRNVAPFMLVAFPAASRLIPPGSAPESTPTTKRPAHVIVLALVAAGELAGLVFLWTRAPEKLGWRPISAGALAAVRTCPGEIYNHFNDGGFLLWFAPDRRVFVDAREDPYPLPLLMEHLAIERGAPYQPLFDRYGIRCAFLPADDRLVPRLRADGWRDDYTDAQWAVLVHK